VEEDFQQVTEVVVIPERLLGDTTTKNILSELQNVKGIKGIIIQGPSYITRTMKIGYHRNRRRRGSGGDEADM